MLSARSATGSAGSTGAADAGEGAYLDGVATKLVVDSAVALSSVPWTNKERQGGGIAPMGSEGPNGAEPDSKKTGVSPQGSGILEACRLRRGRASYARVCECRCRCVSSLLRTDDEGPVVNQVLNDIPESEAIIRRMP